MCSSYLVGALDMMDSLEATTEIVDLACVPADVNADQMAKVVVKYGMDHPEDLHLQATAFAIKSLLERGLVMTRHSSARNAENP
jgi:hypothetical protein